jgi:hypothetical protein
MKHQTDQASAELRAREGCRSEGSLIFSVVLILCGLPFHGYSQLELLPEKEPAEVFGEGERRIGTTWRNTGDSVEEVSLRLRLYQTSATTAVLVSDSIWKKLRVLPGQTILESTRITFPAVNAENRFLIQWITDSNRIVGKREVLVYPRDLLKELKPLAGDEAAGIFDPVNELKPMLKAVNVDFVDLEDAGLDHFHGKLAILGPFRTKDQMRRGFVESVKAMVNKGAGVVWMQPPQERLARLEPSFYAVPAGRGLVVVAQAYLVGNLPESPQAQLNLVQLAKWAVRPEPPRLPQLISGR